LYGKDQPSKDDMMEHALRKKELCEAVISVMDKIIPGRFRLRGMFMSEMYGILYFLAKRAYEGADIDRHEFLRRLEIARDILEESIEVSRKYGVDLKVIHTALEGVFFEKNL
jgi:hypothetical protein